MQHSSDPLKLRIGAPLHATAYRAVAVALLFLSTKGYGQGVTPKDIADGMDARRSKIASIKVRYFVRVERTEEFYRTWERKEKRRADARAAQGVPSRRPAWSPPPRNEWHGYTLVQMGDRRSYEVRDVDDGGRPFVAQRGVYDGEVLRHLNLPVKDAIVHRIAPDEVIRFPTVGTVLSVEGVDIPSYLRDGKIKAQVVRERVEAGDIVADLVTRRDYVPSRDLPVVVTTEHRITVNLSKDFWPIRIDEHVLARDTSAGRRLETHQEQTTINGLRDVAGVYYPTSIATAAFTYDVEHKPGSLIAEIGRKAVSWTRTLGVESVDINSELPDQELQLEFPQGTRYLNDITGETIVVGEPVKNLAELMRDPPLFGSESTSEEAERIRQVRAAATRQGRRWELHVAVGSALAVASCFTGYYLFRRWLPRRKGVR